jgi:hypothetical protein
MKKAAANDGMVVIMDSALWTAREAFGEWVCYGEKGQLAALDFTGRADPVIKLGGSGGLTCTQAMLLDSRQPGGGIGWDSVHPLRLSDLPTEPSGKWDRVDIVLASESEWPFPLLEPVDIRPDERAMLSVIAELEKRGWKWSKVVRELWRIRERYNFSWQALQLGRDGEMFLGHLRNPALSHVQVTARQLVEEELAEKARAEQKEGREKVAAQNVLRAASDRRGGEILPGEVLQEGMIYQVTKLGTRSVLVAGWRLGDLVFWDGEWRNWADGGTDAVRAVQVLVPCVNTPATAGRRTPTLFTYGGAEGLEPVMELQALLDLLNSKHTAPAPTHPEHAASDEAEYECKEYQVEEQRPPDPLAGLTLREQRRVVPFLAPLYKAGYCPVCKRTGGCMCHRGA